MGYRLPPQDDFDEYDELEWIYARRRRRQRVWAVIAAFVAVSMLVLYILADFFRLGRRSEPEPPDTVIRAMAPLVPGPG